MFTFAHSGQFLREQRTINKGNKFLQDGGAEKNTVEETEMIISS